MNLNLVKLTIGWSGEIFFGGGNVQLQQTGF